MSELDNVWKYLNKESHMYLEKFLKNAPMWLLEEFHEVNISKDTEFVSENDPANTVYILLTGVVKATDIRVFPVVYDFIRFYPIEIFGAMEFLLREDTYRTTLITVTNCKFLKLSIEQFSKWVLNDINAMKMFTEAMTRYLLDQCRKERLYLFLQGEERVLLFLSDIYEKNGLADEIVINISRNDLAKGTALSVRTVNRTIKELIKEGFLVKKGRKLILPFEKYQEIKKRLSDKVDMM
ncbi:cyclic nucleotide-binding domain protein [Catonella morbi ATCC 51271]|uniref:Cyclic nucleotide-binding domain protein n=1 Tax=Catonella morbi ATCC 51271 TaxID=592026 RepID=V2Y6G9_9FIRM|nr:Crp/Fnr family transcriptional regulator [Catonella morbi]ESL04548.1 cyclic nucleotide-binding domain protein [Catonella morbi ATCC 51271]